MLNSFGQRNFTAHACKSLTLNALLLLALRSVIQLTASWPVGVRCFSIEMWGGGRIVRVATR